VRSRPALALVTVLVALGALSGCTGSGSAQGRSEGSDQGEGAQVAVDPPEVGACRVLEPADIGESSNDAPPVDCRDDHTAETFYVGTFRGRDAKLDPGDPALGATVFKACDRGFKKFTGADESLAMRSVLSWAWFRPTNDAWDQGARWYRCDVVGGTDASETLVTLPARSAKGVLLGIPDDRWLTCVADATVSGSPRVPCSEKHAWRAVSTIVVGTAQERYPGDRVLMVRSRDSCSDWVGAWMNYPVTDYQFAYTWFPRGEWDAGNRRSICWAKTSE
jgi:hypothetical protein